MFGAKWQLMYCLYSCRRWSINSSILSIARFNVFILKFYLKKIRTCSTTCPAGYIQGANTCETCDANCKTCSPLVKATCLSCDSAVGYLQADACTPTCVGNFYEDDDTATCLICNTWCATCYGTGNTKCYTCVVGKYHRTDVSNTCSDTCPAG